MIDRWELLAEAVRDLTWRGKQANLTKKDSEMLQRGQDFLAAELAEEVLSPERLAAVVASTLLRIGQHLVGLRGLLEALLGLGVVGVVGSRCITAP